MVKITAKQAQLAAAAMKNKKFGPLSKPPVMPVAPNGGKAAPGDLIDADGDGE